jgi:hypothetical protein
MPFNKATLHGPNRAANLKSNKYWEADRRGPYTAQYGDASSQSSADGYMTQQKNDRGTLTSVSPNPSTLLFRVKSMETLREECPEICLPASYEHIGLIWKNDGKATEELLKHHGRLTGMSCCMAPLVLQEPLLIHFHDLPVYIIRVILLENNLVQDSGTSSAREEEYFPVETSGGIDWIYMSEVQLYNRPLGSSTPSRFV